MAASHYGSRHRENRTKKCGDFAGYLGRSDSRSTNWRKRVRSRIPM